MSASKAHFIFSVAKNNVIFLGLTNVNLNTEWIYIFTKQKLHTNRGSVRAASPRKEKCYSAMYCNENSIKDNRDICFGLLGHSSAESNPNYKVGDLVGQEEERKTTKNKDWKQATNPHSSVKPNCSHSLIELCCNVTIVAEQ